MCSKIIAGHPGMEAANYPHKMTTATMFDRRLKVLLWHVWLTSDCFDCLQTVQLLFLSDRHQ